jgi:hypothetical protein
MGQGHISPLRVRAAFGGWSATAAVANRSTPSPSFGPTRSRLTPKPAPVARRPRGKSQPSTLAHLVAIIPMGLGRDGMIQPLSREEIPKFDLSEQKRALSLSTFR